MNWAQFKDSVSHMCLAGAVVASWFLTQEVEGWSPFTAMTNILSLNSVKTSRKKSTEFENCELPTSWCKVIRVSTHTTRYTLAHLIINKDRPI